MIKGHTQVRIITYLLNIAKENSLVKISEKKHLWQKILKGKKQQQ